MKPYDFDRFVKALTRCGGVFSKTVDDVLAQAFYDALRDYPIEAIERALKSHEANAKFFPKPAEIKTRIADAGSYSARVPMGGSETWTGDNFASAREGAQRSKREWNADIAKRGALAKLALLDAYVGRLSIEFERNSPQFDDRISWAREKFSELMGEVDAKQAADSLQVRNLQVALSVQQS